jgi:hypothetical protein
MDSLGLGGLVSSKGWLEVHNPGSTKIKLQMFNCAASTTAGGSSTDFNFNELKLAFRALRAAVGLVMPWNKSMEALDGFLVETDFCFRETGSLEKRAKLISQFIDYVLEQNSRRWRDSEPFLTTGALKMAWSTFFSTRIQGSIPAKKPFQAQGQNHGGNRQQFKTPQFSKEAWDTGCCIKYNLGRCTNKADNCFNKFGKKLKHLCLANPDASKPDVFCLKNHAKIDHK